jgi:hypothetical protein
MKIPLQKDINLKEIIKLLNDPLLDKSLIESYVKPWYLINDLRIDSFSYDTCHSSNYRFPLIKAYWILKKCSSKKTEEGYLITGVKIWFLDKTPICISKDTESAFPQFLWLSKKAAALTKKYLEKNLEKIDPLDSLNYIKPDWSIPLYYNLESSEIIHDKAFYNNKPVQISLGKAPKGSINIIEEPLPNSSNSSNSEKTVPLTVSEKTVPLQDVLFKILT